MRILITYLTFGENIFAGVERSLYSLSLGLIANGNDVCVYTSKFSSVNRATNIKVIKSAFLKSTFDEDVSLLDDNIADNYFNYHDKIKEEMCEIIDTYEPEYILVVDHLWGIVPFIDIFGEFKCPSGMLFHMYHNPKYINLALSKPFDHFFSISNYLTGKLRSISPEFDRKNIDIKLLPNSINVSDFDKYVLKEERARIFCNSRLCPEKGIEILLEAFTNIIQEIPDAHLILCGGNFHFGSNRLTIELINKTIINNNLQGNIDVIPLLSWDDIPKWVCGSNCIVLPTKEETFGIAALEAMAAGTPLIATNVGNIPDLVGNAGILIDNCNTDELTRALLNVLKNKHDLKSLINRGRRKAEQYDYIRVARNFATIIKER